jgi:predicted tellurium resistance membrane protein TerC
VSFLSIFHDVHPADFVTIALLVMLEGLLSADNAMVLAVLVLGLPRKTRRRRCATAFLARLVSPIATVLRRTSFGSAG